MLIASVSYTHLVGEVDILQFCRIPGVVDTFLQLGGEFSLFGDGAENSLFPFGYVAQLIMLLFDLSCV